MQTRRYGSSGPVVVLIHGGPGASGYMAPIARKLGDSFQVLEPLQSGSGPERLTVNSHITDLREMIETSGVSPPLALVGHSWGAMLALAYTAAHPSHVSSVALIGCGTFDEATREHLLATRSKRTDKGLEQQLEHLRRKIPNANKRLKVVGDLTLPLYSYDLTTTHLDVETYDSQAHRETWEDMVRLQDSGVYPAALSGITVPVLMLHGAVDPHPGRMIKESLEKYLPQLQYHEWSHCGHYPWLEKEVSDEFFSVLRKWLTP